ncbi:mechanosensitive ion channel family protein [Candidatus Micrarchaeota archaeon]|nr:mechanosensitive ion channel family protein [Candidatus Micrarchaeota archaeon]
MISDSLAPYLDWTAFGNTGVQYMDSLIYFVTVVIVLWIFKKIVLSALHTLSRKTRHTYDDYIIDFIHEIKAPVYLLTALYVSTQPLTLEPILSKGIEYALAIGIMYYVVKGVNRVISALVDAYTEKRRKKGEHDEAMMNVLKTFAHAIIWVVAALLILDNLGLDIGALLAGVGIGGLAIALAAQAVLSDILASFSIYFDKPFKVGDFIIIGSDMGVVKYIGIKTTRIQTLQGQELVVSNQELTSTRVNNYKRMQKRRIQFSFGIVYGTPIAKMKKIPGMVKKIVDANPLCKTDRVHFKKFGDFSLDYEVVYYLDSADYNVYMDAQQTINLNIADAFEKNKIDFAFPTQTVHIQK